MNGLTHWAGGASPARRRTVAQVHRDRQWILAIRYACVSTLGRERREARGQGRLSAFKAIPQCARITGLCDSANISMDSSVLLHRVSQGIHRCRPTNIALSSRSDAWCLSFHQSRFSPTRPTGRKAAEAFGTGPLLKGSPSEGMQHSQQQADTIPPGRAGARAHDLETPWRGTTD